MSALSPEVGSSALLTMENVEKEYDLRPVLDCVSMDVEEGKTYLLTAANGSGKTTLLQIMAGLVKPTSGRVLWRGAPLSRKTKAKIGVVLQAPMVYGDLTGVENLALYAGLFGIPSPKQAARQWFQRFDLSYAIDQPVREYSKGMRQRLALARALIHQPAMLLLDEPFDGLDSEGVLLVQAMLSEFSRDGGTVFMVAHNLQPVQHVDKYLTLTYGRLVELQ